jgi:hypothetical protein
LSRALQDNSAQIRFGDCLGPYDQRSRVYSPTRLYAAEILKLRMGVMVPEHAEVLEARYGVQRVAPLLYLGNTQLCSSVIEALRYIGGAEAQRALTAFINKKTSEAGMEKVVGEARAALDQLDPYK